MKLLSLLALCSSTSPVPVLDSAAAPPSVIRSAFECPNPQVFEYFSEALSESKLKFQDNRLSLYLRADDVFKIDEKREFLFLIKQEFSVILAHWYNKKYSKKVDSVTLTFAENHITPLNGTFIFRINWEPTTKLNINEVTKEIDILVGDEVEYDAMGIILISLSERQKTANKEDVKYICSEELKPSYICQHLQNPNTDMDQVTNMLTYTLSPSALKRWSQC